jgi:hypothetical protein
MTDNSTVRAETAFNVTAYLQAEDDDRLGSNLTKLFMPGFAIFALYLLIGSSALYPIFSLQIRSLFETNLVARHTLGFFTLLFFVVLSGAKDVEYLHTVLFSVFIYIWFVMTTKLNINYWFFIITIFAMLYSLQLYKQTKNISHREKKIITDVEYGGTAIAFVTTVIGFVSAYFSKKDTHGNAFRFHHFLSGKYD